MNDQEIIELIDTFYRIISGKAEEERDWEGFKRLFFPNACLFSIRVNEDGVCTSKPTDIETYIVGLDKFLKTHNFFEYGLNYDVKIAGNIASVYSEYEAKVSPEDTEIIKRGINLIQLVKDREKWKIVNMLWQDTELNI